MSDDSSRMFLYLKKLIQTSFVGVANPYAGAVKEYFIEVDTDTTISFFVSNSNIEGVPFYEYIITINGDVVANAITSGQCKHLTREEEMVVRLFDLCSARIIFQETRGAIRATMESNKQKNRLN